MSLIAREALVSAPNYAPMPVVIARAQGAHLYDEDGRAYIDMMSAYSAVSHGHRHPRIEKALIDQVQRVSVISRAYHSNALAPFLEKLCQVTGMDAGIPMNSGAEAVETAIKAARRYGHLVKGLPDGAAKIVVFNANFHGRTTTIVGFSSEAEYRAGFGPFSGGFVHVPFGDASALEAVMDETIAAVLMEPIQGEGGIIVPPVGYLRAVRAICDRWGALLIADEVQSGLGRTGRWFGVDHEDVKPDAMCLGKALGGGILPVSAFVARRAVANVFNPGSHGSTFGGNPLAAAVGLEALRVLEEEHLIERSATLGAHLMARLKAIRSPLIADIRGRGLWVGLEIDPAKADAAVIVRDLLRRGVLSKETHKTVIRLAPPLMIDLADLDEAIDRIEAALIAAESTFSPAKAA